MEIKTSEGVGRNTAHGAWELRGKPGLSPPSPTEQGAAYNKASPPQSWGGCGSQEPGAPVGHHTWATFCHHGAMSQVQQFMLRHEMLCCKQELNPLTHNTSPNSRIFTKKPTGRSLVMDCQT